MAVAMLKKPLFLYSHYKFIIERVSLGLPDSATLHLWAVNFGRRVELRRRLAFHKVSTLKMNERFLVFFYIYRIVSPALSIISSSIYFGQYFIWWVSKSITCCWFKKDNCKLFSIPKRNFCKFNFDSDVHGYDFLKIVFPSILHDVKPNNVRTWTVIRLKMLETPSVTFIVDSELFSSYLHLIANDV